VASRAVIIGPASYAPDSGIPAHETIGASARMYGEVLREDPMWGAGRVTVLEPGKLGSVPDVMGAVQAATEQVEPGDILLVVYVGHGAYWHDVPGAQVHFAVNSSRDGQPHTWLSSWYLYRAIRRSRASLKVLIADCCYSNLLPQLGGGDAALPGALGVLDEGTCVLTAVKDVPLTSALGCSKLPERLAACTPFSGHLLNVLSRGTSDHNDTLNLGLIRDAVRKDLSGCGVGQHEQPRMILNDAREGVPLFTNRTAPAARQRPPHLPNTAREWVSALMKENEVELDALLTDATMTGDVVAELWKGPGESGRRIARRINDRATEHFREDTAFAQYWDRVERVLYA
jgi:hypothetical protein